MAEGKGMEGGRSVARALVALGTLALLVTGLGSDVVAETEGRIEGVALESAGASTKVVIRLWITAIVCSILALSSLKLR